MGNSNTTSISEDKNEPLVIKEYFSIDDYLETFVKNYILYLKQNDKYDNTFTEFYYSRIINRALYRIYQEERLNNFDNELLAYLHTYDLYNEIEQNSDVIERILTDASNNELIVSKPLAPPINPKECEPIEFKYELLEYKIDKDYQIPIPRMKNEQVTCGISELQRPSELLNTFSDDESSENDLVNSFVYLNNFKKIN